MAKRYPCERVAMDFVDTAPYRFVCTVDLAITPEQLFEVLEDAESWPRWASVITKVTWTSEPPRGVGTTRTVDMRGFISGDEEFLVWEPYSRVGFRFNAATTSAIAAFAEDYHVVRTPQGCHLTWIMALKPRGLAASISMFAARPVMAWLFQRYLNNLRPYTDERFAVSRS